MKIENRRLSVSLAKKINMGNYESFQIQAGLTVDISDDTDIQEAYDELFDECTHQVFSYEKELLDTEDQSTRKGKER